MKQLNVILKMNVFNKRKRQLCMFPERNWYYVLTNKKHARKIKIKTNEFNN